MRVTPPVARAIIDADQLDLRWSSDPPLDPLRPGTWHVYRDRTSTRWTTVEYEDDRLTVTIRSGACAEDCELAFGVLRRAVSAAGGDGRVDTVYGALTPDEMDEVYGSWCRDQLDSAARIVVDLAKKRGPIAMPGPTREVWIGPRSIAELEAGDPAQMADRLVRLMRRVLWPDPRYQHRSELVVEPPGGDRYTLAVLVPIAPCVLPRTDRIAIAENKGYFQIPRAALARLELDVTDLDDGNQLVEGVPLDDWPALCEAAQAYRLDDAP